MVRLFKRLLSSVAPGPLRAVVVAHADGGGAAAEAVSAPAKRPRARERVPAEPPVPVEPVRRTPSPGRTRFRPRGSMVAAVALLAILAGATFLRVWKLDAIGFRGDEAVYAGQASVLAGSHEAERWFTLISRGNSNFLLYQHLLAVIYMLFGISDLAARLLSAVFSVATVLAVFELGRTLYSRRVGLIAAALAAVSGYSVALARLAELDPTATFFFVAAMVAAAKYTRATSARARTPWIAAFAGLLALAVQGKVTTALALPAVFFYLVLSRTLRQVTLRQVLIAIVVFVVCLTPALIQLAENGHAFLRLLSDSTKRVSEVPWYYYVRIITGHEGYVLPLVWLAGIFWAVRRRTRSDLFLLSWLYVVATFLELYPLKAFNYLLPVIPPAVILAARAISEVIDAFARSRAVRYVVACAFAAGLGLAVVQPLKAVIGSSEYVGLREAARWLEAHSPRNAGVMLPSNGSAQYVISFYGHRDAYPFGRFRLATVLPGGKILRPRIFDVRGTPRDWVYYWPPRLIRSRTISYLVYYTQQGDDPPEAPIVEGANQKNFRDLIEQFGGRLLHVERYNHESRVWVYRVTRLLPHARISGSLVRRGSSQSRNAALVARLQGEGFGMNSVVTLYYHRLPVKQILADNDGSFSSTIRVPLHRFRRKYWFVARGKDVFASVSGVELSG